MVHEYIWGTEDWIYEDKGILIKKIDANDKLSVQVHPDDDYAKDHGLENGKTECWYITDCEEGAFLYCGIEDPDSFSPSDFAEAVEDGSVERFLKKVYVAPGDFIFIPAGSVHAIGKGIKLIEVQQDSTTTYRLYDYMRTDANGNPRELHVRQGLECIKPDAPCGKYSLPFTCKYFAVDVDNGNLIVSFKKEKLSIPLK